MVCSLPCVYNVLDKSCASVLLHQLTEPRRNFDFVLGKNWFLELLFILCFFKTSYIAMQLVILRRKDAHTLTCTHTQTYILWFVCIVCSLGAIPSDLKIRIFRHASEQSGKLRFFYNLLGIPHLLTSSWYFMDLKSRTTVTCK